MGVEDRLFVQKKRKVEEPKRKQTDRLRGSGLRLSMK